MTPTLGFATTVNVVAAAILIEYLTLHIIKKFGVRKFLTPPKSSDLFNEDSKLVHFINWLNNHRRLRSVMSWGMVAGAMSPAALTLVGLDLWYPAASQLIMTIGLPYTMITALTLIFLLQFMAFGATHPRRLSSSQLEKLLSVSNREINGASLENAAGKSTLVLTGGLSWLVLGTAVLSLLLLEADLYQAVSPELQHLTLALAIGLFVGSSVVRRARGLRKTKLDMFLETSLPRQTESLPIMDNWASSYTAPLRYSYWGITEFALEYAEKTGKTSLTILDVGCSTGVASADMKSKLVARGVSVKLIGVDVNPDIADMARQNLDEFILADILEMDSEALPRADMVICSFAAIFVEAWRRSRMIQKCALALKPDGRLITNADRFQRASFGHQLGISAYRLGAAGQFSHGIRAFLGENRERAYQVRKKRTYVVDGRESALDHADQIMEGWGRLDPLSKWAWLFHIVLGNTEARLIRYVRRITRRIFASSG